MWGFADIFRNESVNKNPSFFVDITLNFVPDPSPNIIANATRNQFISGRLFQTLRKPRETN